MTILSDSRAIVKRILPDLIALRHQLHRIPEIACEERDTGALIRRSLAGLSVRLLPPFIGTDVVGVLKGGRPGPSVMLRADMDALPIEEKSGVPYASERKGMMHACGHDGHMAVLVGAARVLDRLAPRLAGSVRFVFQPGEEVRAAARDLVKAGAIRNPVPAMAFALHAYPTTPVGSIGAIAGPACAAADFFEITVKGRGGHGSAPHRALNPIPVAARIVSALEGIPSGQVNALDPFVVSACRIASGTTDNVIPPQAVIAGTVRWYKDSVGEAAPVLIKRAVRGICGASGAGYRVRYEQQYPPVINDQAAVAIGRQAVAETLGKSRWEEVKAPEMGAEDFAFYLRECPGAMFHLGMGPKSPMLHNDRFDFNDDALGNGVLFLVSAAIGALAALKGKRA